MHRSTPILLLLCAAAACSKSPAGPSSPNSSGVLQGQTVSAVDGAVTPNVSVQVGTRFPVTTDSNGHFEIEVGGPGSFDVKVRGTAIVERQTTVATPSSGPARLSLIPSAFDLTAFDEMFRTANERLQRWTSRPSLVVLGSVMQYRNGGGTEFNATAEQLSEDEATQMVAHLNEGLALLTGNTFTTFESVAIERPAAGERVEVARTGRIVVGRYNGIVTFAHTIGYGQWSEQSNGTIIGGSMFLDREFDRDDPRRRLLRIHELGHALGYLHVTTRTSIMNPAIGPEPTDFDRAAARVAFQRFPGNRAPDIDPPVSSAAFAVTHGGGVWKTIYCR
jgi:hypothetical protein